MAETEALVCVRCDADLMTDPVVGIGFVHTEMRSPDEAIEQQRLCPQGGFHAIRKPSIGNVHVVWGMPPGGNPYRPSANKVGGSHRALALKEFRDGIADDDYTFWFAPANGGAHQIFSPDEIDWSGMR